MARHSKLDTAKRFGFQWDRYRRMVPEYRDQLVGWLAPFELADMADKVILDAGCGMGRNSYWIAKEGAAEVHAVDGSDLAVASARQLLEPLPGVTVAHQSLYDMDHGERFDLAICVGVLHHLETPARALGRLYDSLKPGGQLIAWLYGFEGNEVYATVHGAVHPLLRRLSPRSLGALSHALTAPLMAGVRLPLPRLSPYMRSLRAFDYTHTHLIVLDQLVPDVARYYKKREVTALFEASPFASFDVHHNRGYSWTVIAQK